MAPLRHDDRALAAHADEVVARARGRTLLLGDPTRHTDQLPPAVSEVVQITHTNGDRSGVVGCFDTMVSVGALAETVDLGGVLAELGAHLHRDGFLLFCEPTSLSSNGSATPPHDITGTLWAGDWSVLECRRLVAGRGRRHRQYCWGRARVTRFVGPQRR